MKKTVIAAFVAVVFAACARADSDGTDTVPGLATPSPDTVVKTQTDTVVRTDTVRDTSDTTKSKNP